MGQGSDGRQVQSGVQDLRIFRNRQLVGYVRRPTATGDTVTIHLPDTPGTVSFEAYAFNGDGV